MNDYMQALHQRFFREPECADVREEIEELRQELRETLQKPERRKLLRLVDVQNLLRCILSSKNPWFCQSKFLGTATEIPW